MNTSPRFDDTHWPILTIYVPSRVDSAALPAAFAEWERLCVERGPHVAVLDMRDFDPMQALGPIRHVAAREVARGMPIYRDTLLGVVRLVAHPLTRALLTAFDWLVPLPWPVCNTETAHVGASWLVRKADEHGLAVTTTFDIDRQRAIERGEHVGLAS